MSTESRAPKRTDATRSPEARRRTIARRQARALKYGGTR